MNFDEAIRAHSDWKMKLQRYLSNPDGSINPSELAKDNACSLGSWLYGEGSKYKTVEGFNDLVMAHKKFHKEAADIVLRKQRGEDVKSDIALGGSSPFAQASSNVVSILMKFKSKVG